PKAQAVAPAPAESPEMANDLRRQLELLEAEYPGQPLVAQQTDLRVINELRGQLGLPHVDARLRVVATEPSVPVAKAEPPKGPDHSAAREIYRVYLTKKAELDVHRAYAERVARATAGNGQTPVRPLATMGTGGGPLLCDRCHKPMLLEGGRYNGKTADAGWRLNPDPDWKSWILKGMVVEIVLNGTLRIYHGYPGANDKQCCNAARRQDEKAQQEFRSARPPGAFNQLRAFLADEFPDLDDRARSDLLNEVLNTLYDYDPGIGINRPDGPTE
ncbi:MAG: hypothetical protein K2V38_09575, partial [Gemmataceae bacterium]|nr:hypothetical protein [Gemmataceae bacterium]